METGYKAASFLSKVVLALVIIAFLLDMIGFYTVNWHTIDYVDPFRLTERLSVREYFGLWKHCIQTRFMTKCNNFKSLGSKYYKSMTYVIVKHM